MADRADVPLRLSAQRALLGAVTPALRSFSVEQSESVILTQAVFEREPTAGERELIQVAATEIIADYLDKQLDERILVSSEIKPPSLALLVYRRYEPPRP